LVYSHLYTLAKHNELVKLNFYQTVRGKIQLNKKDYPTIL